MKTATQTTDYSKFKFIDTNRAIKNNRDLKESLKTYGWLKSRPLVVNQNNQVLDGQHRLVYAQELGIPVHFQIEITKDRKHDEELILSLNKSQKVWRLYDYIQSHAIKGVKFHQEVKDFEEEFKLGISNSIVICVGSNNGTNANAIREGVDIKLNPKRKAVASFVAACNQLPYSKTKIFVQAAKTLYAKAKPEQIQKVFKRHTGIRQQPTIQAYLAVFENIINRGTSVNKISLQ